MGLSKPEHKSNNSGRRGVGRGWLLPLALLLCSPGLLSQQTEMSDELLDQPESATVSVLEVLPETRHLAASLSDPASRPDTLMTVLAGKELVDLSAPVRDYLPQIPESWSDARVTHPW